MKKVLLFFLLSILVQPLFATSIVVLIASNYIIIGADSKRLIVDAEKNHTVIETVCKIRMVNSYCYAAAGTVASAATGFSADHIIQQHLQKTASLQKAVQSIQKDVSKALHAELVYQKKHQPKQYQKTIESKNHLLEVVVVQVKNGQPQAYVVGFELGNEKNLKIKSYSKSCGTNCVTSGPKFFFLGEYSGMEKYLDAVQENVDPVRLINQLIVSQAIVTPRSVGAPVNMVKLNAKGMEWLNPPCN